MSDDQETDGERPCLHCLMVELIDDFFAEYPVATGEPRCCETSSQTGSNGGGLSKTRQCTWLVTVDECHSN